jgi:outer membrane lipoprotein-sorting protein
MKKITAIAFIALMAVSVGLMNFDFKEPTALEIIKKADAKLRGKSSQSSMTMKIVRPKYTRTMKLKSWSKGNDYAMMLVTYPARDKGTTTLKRKKEMWSYQPRVNRVIKMPPSMMMQSWMGSDITNDDLVRQSSIVRDYKHKKLGKEKVEGRMCYKLELTPKPDAPVVWGKIRMWIDTKEFMQMKTKFYDEDGYLVNTMKGKKVKKFGSKTLPSVMEIIPADEKGHKTVLTYNTLKFNVALKDSFFSKQNMKKVK